MVSPEPSEKGLSETRKWGVKSHIERIAPAVPDPESAYVQPFNWQRIYALEKAALEKKARESAN
jgi:hypothetical protein